MQHKEGGVGPLPIVEKVRARFRRLPHWAVDGLIGLASALAAITVAQAALPKPKPPVQPIALQPVAREPQAAPEPQAAADTPTEAQAQPEAQPVAAIAFGRPIDGYRIVSPFGVRQLPWEGAGRLHAGVDIAAPYGSPVFAAADGVVVGAGVNGGYGRYVELRHAGGLRTRYGHLSTWSARLTPGAYVSAGEQIAQVGSTGSSTGAHLHFEIRDARGRPLNPEFFMNRAFASLDDLPVDQAARYSGTVRIAYVSGYPRGRRPAASGGVRYVQGPDGRGVERRVLPSGALVIHLGG
jgi:murein DD-endopeptidase MepM/ murein hydrolase activator NlpD